jgi:hypothetical protein
MSDSEVNKLPDLWMAFSYLVRFSAVLPDLMIGQGLFFDLLFRKTWNIAETLAYRINIEIF